MPGVSYTTGGGANLPGNLGWTVDYKFKPNAPAASKGVNAGESLAFNLNGFGLSDITAGNVKFGLHSKGCPMAATKNWLPPCPKLKPMPGRRRLGRGRLAVAAPSPNPLISPPQVRSTRPTGRVFLCTPFGTFFS